MSAIDAVSFVLGCGAGVFAAIAFSVAYDVFGDVSNPWGRR